MTSPVSAAATAVVAAVPDCVSAPKWAVDRVGEGSIRAQYLSSGVHVELIDGGDAALTTARLPHAASMDAATMERRVTDAYAAIVERISRLDANRPVRLWNHIPSIHERMDARRDRYMVFNAGRYNAFARMYGGPQAFGQEVATASGVGHANGDLVVHCLSGRSSGLAIDNPRQIAPHRYSKRYGPLPPCFARATLLADEGLILVGGTASICGEDSLHVTDLAMQMDETLTNLASVVEAAHVKAGRRGANESDPAGVGVGSDSRRGGRARWLAQYLDVRVYYPRAADREWIEAEARAAFGPACRVEMCRADLCRAELLVEIEGVAALGR